MQICQHIARIQDMVNSAVVPTSDTIDAIALEVEGVLQTLYDNECDTDLLDNATPLSYMKITA